MHIDVQDVHKKWKLFTLTNKHGMRVSILNFGGILTDISVVNKQGVLENVVLGFKDVADYEHNPNYIGALIGPVAGRIRSEEHTSELQSRGHLVCRLLLEKKNN